MHSHRYSHHREKTPCSQSGYLSLSICLSSDAVDGAAGVECVVEEEVVMRHVAL